MNSNEMAGPYDSFEQHSDDAEWSSSKDLVYPQPSYHINTKAYAFGDYPVRTAPQPEPTGIHVQKQFDMV